MKSVLHRLTKAIPPILGLVTLALIIAWMSGIFQKKVPAGESAGIVLTQPVPQSASVVRVEQRSIPVEVRAPGTVRARFKTAVGSRILAPVRKIHVTAGTRASKGDVLVELDQADLLARKNQTEADLDAGRARLSKAEDDLHRIRSLTKSNAATERELYDAERALDVAKANTNSLEQRLAEVTTQLQYATITAPFDGIVIDKQIDVGDLATPGKTLVTLYDPTRLQLEAEVPESAAIHLSPGDEVGVEIQSINTQCIAKVSEIVPQASPATRSMLVKVTGPCPPGVVSGMFGRLIIRTGEKKQLLIPASAVLHLGQLEFVYVVVPNPGPNDNASRYAAKRFIQIGKQTDGMVEVLAGLQPDNDIIANPEVF